MRDTPRIISGHKIIIDAYPDLVKGDIISGRIPMKPGEEHLLLDLAERQVHMIPSATAQLASRSKAFQAEILKPWMIPETTVIYNRHQLLETTNHYHKKNIGQVILKQDRKNAGMGILLYGTIEDIYNQAAHKALAYPFVLQPFLPGCIDMRIVILDGYTEAYQRCNPYSFRNNLHCGGKASPCVLSEEAHQFCGEVMARGSFPYGHLDLMVNGEGILYLAEINLRGGIRGARIGKGEYDKRVDAIEKKLLARFLNEAQADPV